MKSFENGDLFATVKIILETVDEEGKVEKKEMGSVYEAERQAMLFVGLLREPAYLEPEEVEIVEESIARDENRIYHVVSIDGEYIGWSSEAGLSSLKDYAGRPVIVLTPDEEGVMYRVNGWEIRLSNFSEGFVAYREEERHLSDNFWQLVGKCKQ